MAKKQKEWMRPVALSHPKGHSKAKMLHFDQKSEKKNQTTTQNIITFYLCYLTFFSFNKTFKVESFAMEKLCKDKEKDKHGAIRVNCESIPKQQLIQ